MTRTSVQVGSVHRDDLEAVIALDRAITGRPDRGFYEKRFAIAQENPEAYVLLAARLDGKVVGVLSGHILNGEFGGTTPVGVIDAIGADPTRRGQGIGRTLMAAFEETLKARGVSTIYTEADWTDRDLVGFLAAAGYQLAPSLALEHVITPAA